MLEVRGYIQSTANDYDLPINIVQEVYNQYDGLAFHEKLEEIINIRSKEI